MNFDEALSYLLSLGHETLAIKLGLTNTERLLEALGNPHRLYPAVQIAGTNGKGSTAAFLDSICRAAGIRTGLFTSPHLVSIIERIRVDDKPIFEIQFARLTGVVKAVAEQLVARGESQTLPTFFEHVTAVALLAFARAQIDLAILETGLGGRLDSTTAARADLVAITPIAMDHEEYLGYTLEQIAAEKAAIIRPGVTAVIGRQNKSVLPVILKQCDTANITPQLVANDNGMPSLPAIRVSHVGNTEDGRFRVTFETSQTTYTDVLLGLRGRHQIDNAAVAIGLAEALRERRFPISRDAIVGGLENAKHPGRLELWDGERPIFFDGAHNTAAALALRDYLNEFITRPITMIFAAMRDKHLREMAAALFPKADRLVLTKIDNPRAASRQQLLDAIPNGFEHARVHYATSVEDALKMAHELTRPGDPILVTGSLYLVGAVQAALSHALLPT